MLALTAFAWAVWWAAPPPPPPEPPADPEVSALIDQLALPGGKVRVGPTVVPGGECLAFSPPMLELIRLGPRARPLLHRRLADPAVQDEVALVLGAVGDRTSVRLLVEAYPAGDARGLGRGDPRWEKVVCFTAALTYLTAQPIGRSRYGADGDPGNWLRWRWWWKTRGCLLDVPAEKPGETWVPDYPEAADGV